MLAGDREGLTELARPRAQLSQVLHPATLPLQLDAGGRLERANEDRLGIVPAAADEVQAPVDPVRAIDVRVARGTEHRRVAGGAPTVGVTRGVFLVVGLDLHDRSPHFVHEQRCTDQLGRDLVDTSCEEVTLQHRRARRSEEARGTPTRAGDNLPRRRRRPRRSRNVGSSPTRGLRLRGSRWTARLRPA